MEPNQRWQWTRTRAIGAALVAGAAVLTPFVWQPWYLTIPLVVSCLVPFLLFSYAVTPVRLGGVVLVAVVGGLVVALRVHPWYAGLPVLIALAVMILEAQLSLVERGVILAIGLVVGALLMPAVTPDHTRRNQIRAESQARDRPMPLPPAPEPQPTEAVQRR